MDNIDRNLLPGTLREIAELIDLAPTMALVDVYGGVGVYVPKTMPDDHPISHLIGYENAEKLADKYGGEKLEIARAEAALREIRNREIRSLWPQLSQRQLALKYRTTERTIRNILLQVGDDRQPGLFNEMEI